MPYICIINQSKMNTFSYIVHKIHSLSDEQYHFDLTNLSINNRSAYMKLDIDNTIRRFGSHSTSNLVHNMIFHIKTSNNVSPNGILTKFEHFSMATGLSFISDEVKKYIANLHIRSQRHYNALRKFAHIFKAKRAPIIMNTDLYLNEIRITERNVIVLLQNNYRYLFTITDLNKIIETSLCNSPYFISEPIPVKNPYNKMPFSKSDLYNIYFQIKDRLMRTPDILYQFFLSNFNLSKFKRNNQVLIREKYIHRFIENEDQETLVDYVYNALSFNTHIKIDDDFPDDELVRIFKPYLRLYLEMNYSFDSSVRHRSKCLLLHKLHIFHMHNPQFGRRLYRLKNKRVIGEATFNSDHIEFKRSRDDAASFLTSHATLQSESDDYQTQNSHIHFINEDADDDEEEAEFDDETLVEEENAAELTQSDIEQHADENYDNEQNSDDEFNELARNVYSEVRQRHEQFALPIIDNESFDFDSELGEENEDMYDP